MSDELDRRDALQILIALRSGAASSKAARAITVGTEDIELRLLAIVRQSVTASSANRFVVVSADWGCGKSHLRTLLGARLFSDRIPFVCDCIDGRASSLSHLHRVMPRWLEKLQIGAHVGLRGALLQNELCIDSALAWARRRPDPFARGLIAALGGASAGWLLALGHNYRTPDYAYQHHKAIKLLCACGEFLAHQGRGPVVVFLDEMENVDKQYNICGRRNTYATLARLVRHPHILPILLVTPRFFAQIEEDHRHGLRNGWYGWFPEAKNLLREMPLQDVLSPISFNREMAEQVVRNVGSVFLAAYGTAPPAAIIPEVVDAWWRSSTRSVRFLIRLAVSELDQRHQAEAHVGNNGKPRKVDPPPRVPAAPESCAGVL